MNLTKLAMAAIAIIYGLVRLAELSIHEDVLPVLIVVLGILWLYESSGRSTTVNRPAKQPVA